MPAWNEILNELQSTQTLTPNGPVFNYDGIRRKYLQLLATRRNRNVIIYYSDWLNPSKRINIDINDGDMSGFMNAVHGLDKTKGLDLILHTPGGYPTATDSIVKYLHSIFGNDIEIFVPHLAMSAGTMLCCSSKRVWMGLQSSLGPIDPQFNGIPAYSIKKEFEDAKRELETRPESFRNWQILLSKYPQAFYYIVNDSIKLSSKLVKSWLDRYMFCKDTKNKEAKIEKIIQNLNVNTGSHSTHFDFNFCKRIGLKVKSLESDQKLQDLVLSVFHTFQITGSGTPCSKIIENNLGKAYIIFNK